MKRWIPVAVALLLGAVSTAFVWFLWHVDVAVREKALLSDDYMSVASAIDASAQDWARAMNSGEITDVAKFGEIAELSIGLLTGGRVRAEHNVVLDRGADVVVDVVSYEPAFDDGRVWRVWLTKQRGLWECPERPGWYWRSQGSSNPPEHVIRHLGAPGSTPGG